MCARRSERGEVAAVQGKLLALGLDDFPAPIETGRADVVPPVHLSGRGLDGKRRTRESVVGATHVALGG
jgi:hypothetical protein